MLARRFLERSRRAFGDVKGLEQALAAALEQGRGANPGVELDAERFVDVLADWVEPGPSAAAAIEALRADALYLVGACLDGVHGALELLEKRHFGRLASALRTLGDGASIADDVRQELRIKLFAGTHPKLALYRGTGDLGRWLSAVAVNTGIRMAGKHSKETPLSENFAERIMATADPATAALKKRFGPAVREALAGAVSALPAQSRTELIQYYVDGLNVTELGVLYGIAPSSISRRLAKTRDAVLVETRRQIEQRLAVEGREVDSIIRLVLSQLELSRSMLAR